MSLSHRWPDFFLMLVVHLRWGRLISIASLPRLAHAEECESLIGVGLAMQMLGKKGPRLADQTRALNLKPRQYIRGRGTMAASAVG
jgi:hypothetical protein